MGRKGTSSRWPQAQEREARVKASIHMIVNLDIVCSVFSNNVDELRKTFTL